ncbi:hypothetical protein HHI36_002737 [Cryptolaemus montrouzieri]|uniref:Uncharacterized protein n=1 Tax=Cryptolaemus montrouzieri TaxID=559131 RepID=A0ABD2PBD1_9CUCU
MSDPADITDSFKNMTKLKEKICLICGQMGDTINNKLKNLSCTILTNCIDAIGVRKRSQSDRSRKSVDSSIIQLPKDLEEKGYHQQCNKQWTILSGKTKFEENYDTSQSNKDNTR